MRPFYYILLSLLHLYALVSCTSPSDTAPEIKAYTLKEAGTKAWRSPAVDIPATRFVDFYNDGQHQYLVWENRFSPAVEFYNWSGDSISFSMMPELDELGKRCHMRGFFVASLDSIYVLDAFNNQLLLFSGNGKLAASHILKDTAGTQQKVEYSMPGIYAGSPGLRQGDWLNMFCVPESGCSNPISYTEGKVNVAVNLKTGEYRYSYGYPAVYQQRNEYQSFCVNINRCQTPEGKFLYSFGAEDSVRLTDYKQEDQLFYAGSNYMAKPVEQLSEPTRRPIAAYGGILYDAKNEVYYRMALHSLPDTTHRYQGYEQPISIIILDRQFKKVGESLLPSKKHLYYQWFIGPDGLYISNHYPQKLTPSQGMLSFTRYELVAEHH